MRKLASNPSAGVTSPGYSETLKNIADSKIDRVDSSFLMEMILLSVLPVVALILL